MAVTLQSCPLIIDKPIVLIGLMGAGKTSIGRRLAHRLALPFADADEEIASAAGRTIEEIFATLGESVFRDGERRVIARLLGHGPQVLATGGGAFVDPETRARIKATALSVWLRADLHVLVRRTSGRNGRPLLKDRDPADVLGRLMAERYPVYAEADVIVDSRDEARERTVRRIVTALGERFDAASPRPEGT
jgi:shikimate kinase